MKKIHLKNFLDEKPEYNWAYHLEEAKTFNCLLIQMEQNYDKFYPLLFTNYFFLAISEEFSIDIVTVKKRILSFLLKSNLKVETYRYISFHKMKNLCRDSHEDKSFTNLISKNFPKLYNKKHPSKYLNKRAQENKKIYALLSPLTGTLVFLLSIKMVLSVTLPFSISYVSAIFQGIETSIEFNQQINSISDIEFSALSFMYFFSMIVFYIIVTMMNIRLLPLSVRYSNKLLKKGIENRDKLLKLCYKKNKLIAQNK